MAAHINVNFGGGIDEVVDCAEDGQLRFSEYGGALGVVYTDSAQVSLNAYENVVMRCQGNVHLEGTSSVSGQVWVFDTALPYEQVLLGLAGIVCGALIVWAFLHH
jgi:hypothetical protein